MAPAEYYEPPPLQYLGGSIQFRSVDQGVVGVTVKDAKHQLARAEKAQRERKQAAKAMRKAEKERNKIRGAALTALSDEAKNGGGLSRVKAAEALLNRV